MSKKNVLIVDDEANIRLILSNFLKDNYIVSTSEDGLQAMSFIEDGNVPDLIVHDLMMPNMDGFEFIQQIRSSNIYKDIPIITLSGKEKSEDRVKCLDLGSDDYIVKPFNPQEVKARIGSLIRRASR